MNRRNIKNFQGCLIGGAIGDALGAPIEFMSIDQIRSSFGEIGLTDYSEAYGRNGAVTDDTQMTLFTAEGLILSKVRREYEGDTGIISAGYHALLRWLYTQETNLQDNLVQTHGTCSIVDGVLIGHKELFSLRAPGNSCLSSLKSGKIGTIGDPMGMFKILCHGFSSRVYLTASGSKSQVREWAFNPPRRRSWLLLERSPWNNSFHM